MKITMYVSTNTVGSENTCNFDVPDEEIEGMTEEEIDEYIMDTYVTEWIWDHIYCGFRKGWKK